MERWKKMRKVKYVIYVVLIVLCIICKISMVLVAMGAAWMLNKWYIAIPVGIWIFHQIISVLVVTYYNEEKTETQYDIIMERLEVLRKAVDRLYLGDILRKEDVK